MKYAFVLVLILFITNNSFGEALKINQQDIRVMVVEIKKEIKNSRKAIQNLDDLTGRHIPLGVEKSDILEKLAAEGFNVKPISSDNKIDEKCDSKYNANMKIGFWHNLLFGHSAYGINLCFDNGKLVRLTAGYGFIGL